MTRPRFTPYAAYKDSGVEWLGEIPTHWEVLRLKHLGSLQAGSAITAKLSRGTAAWIRFVALSNRLAD